MKEKRALEILKQLVNEHFYIGDEKLYWSYVSDTCISDVDTKELEEELVDLKKSLD